MCRFMTKTGQIVANREVLLIALIGLNPNPLFMHLVLRQEENNNLTNRVGKKRTMKV